MASMIETRNGVTSIGRPQPAQAMASVSLKTVGIRIPRIVLPRKVFAIGPIVASTRRTR